MKQTGKIIPAIFASLAVCCASAPVAIAQEAPVAPTTPAPTVTLPGGATSLNETHGDWSVRCSIQDNVKQCSLSQQHIDPETRQRVIAVELRALKDGKSEGALVLPFGLALANGVVLRIDEGTPMPALPFTTCLPSGCVVPISFDAATITAIRQGKQIELAATASGGNPITFNVSLTGISSALDRVAELSNP